MLLFLFVAGESGFVKNSRALQPYEGTIFRLPWICPELLTH